MLDIKEFKLHILLIIFGMTSLLFSCSEINEDLLVVIPIEEDFSSIANPQERWEAYGIDNYIIHEQRFCECLPPNDFDLIVNKGVKADVNYTLPVELSYNRTEKKIYDYTKRVAVSIDGAFSLIESYSETAYVINVTYNPKYGYPEKLFIDVDSLIVDEEIIYYFSDLRKTIGN